MEPTPPLPQRHLIFQSPRIEGGTYSKESRETAQAILVGFGMFWRTIR